MKMSIRRLLQEFDSRELSDWQTYYSLEPWGWEQETLLFGTVCHQLSPKAHDVLASPRNWFTDELPKLSAYDPDPDEC